MKPTPDWGPAFEENRKDTMYERTNTLWIDQGYNNLAFVSDKMSQNFFTNLDTNIEQPPSYTESTYL